MAKQREIEARGRYARRHLSGALTGEVRAQVTTLLTGLVAAGATGALTQGHGWLVGVVLTVLAGIGGFLLGVVLVLGGLWFVAPSKQRDVLYDDLEATRANAAETEATLRAEIETLRGVAPKPDFFGDRVEPAQPIIDGTTQTFAFGLVRNRKSLPDRGEIARSARLSLDFYDLNGLHVLGPISGRWRDAPSPIALPPTQLHTHTETIDLEPNEAIHEFDLGTKRFEEMSFVAIDAKQNVYQLPNHTRLRVQVRLAGSNFPDVVGTFLVESLGPNNTMNATLEGVSYS